MDTRKAIQILRRLMLPVKISYDINHKHESRAAEREIAKDTAEALKMAIEALGMAERLQSLMLEETCDEKTCGEYCMMCTYYDYKCGYEQALIDVRGESE